MYEVIFWNAWNISGKVFKKMHTASASGQGQVTGREGRGHILLYIISNHETEWWLYHESLLTS